MECLHLAAVKIQSWYRGVQTRFIIKAGVDKFVQIVNMMILSHQKSEGYVLSPCGDDMLEWYQLFLEYCSHHVTHLFSATSLYFELFSNQAQAWKGTERILVHSIRSLDLHNDIDWLEKALSNRIDVSVPPWNIISYICLMCICSF